MTFPSSDGDELGSAPSSGAQVGPGALSSDDRIGDNRTGDVRTGDNRAGGNGAAERDGDDAPHPAVVSRPPQGLLARGVTAAVRLSVAAVKLPFQIAQPIVMSRPMMPAREAANTAVNKISDALISVVSDQLVFNNEAQLLIETFVDRIVILLTQMPVVKELVSVQAEAYINRLSEKPELVAALVDKAAGAYILRLQQNPSLVRQLVRTVAGDYVNYLSRNPDVMADVVEAVAGDYIYTLQQRPDFVDVLVRTVGDRCIQYLSTKPEFVQSLVQGVAGDYVTYLSSNPAVVDGLVENVAANYISHLQENPSLLDGVVAGAADRFMESVRADPSEVNQLVQVVGDMYLEYLRVYPDNVQDLLAGQTVSITNDVVAEVRKRSASGDARLETALRNLLRLKPREDKPLPDIEPLV